MSEISKLEQTLIIKKIEKSEKIGRWGKLKNMEILDGGEFERTGNVWMLGKFGKSGKPRRFKL